MNRRNFIISAFKAGGLTAMASLGLSPKAMADFIRGGGTGTCSGNYGHTTADETDMPTTDASGIIYLSPITIDCSDSAVTVYVYNRYWDADHIFIGLYSITPDGFTLTKVAEGSSQYGQLQGFASQALTASLSPGVYYVAFQSDGDGTQRFDTTAAVGSEYLYIAGTYGTLPTSITKAATTAVPDVEIIAYLAF